MDKEQIMNSVEQYAKEVEKELKPHAIILFGSYVNGTPNEDSDIDIAVIFDNYPRDKWMMSSRLRELTCKIDDRIEPILLDSTKDSSGFVAEVMKTGKIIYQAS